MRTNNAKRDLYVGEESSVHKI